jgi:hypothetical protein
MVSSGLLRRVALVRTQKTPFFIVTAVKTSNLTISIMLLSLGVTDTHTEVPMTAIS